MRYDRCMRDLTTVVGRRMETPIGNTIIAAFVLTAALADVRWRKIPRPLTVATGKTVSCYRNNCLGRRTTVAEMGHFCRCARGRSNVKYKKTLREEESRQLRDSAP